MGCPPEVLSEVNAGARRLRELGRPTITFLDAAPGSKVRFVQRNTRIESDGPAPNIRGVAAGENAEVDALIENTEIRSADPTEIARMADALVSALEVPQPDRGGARRTLQAMLQTLPALSEMYRVTRHYLGLP